MRRSNVVLPLPLGPSSATMELGSMSTSTPSTALNRPLAVLKCFTMLRTCGVLRVGRWCWGGRWCWSGCGGSWRATGRYGVGLD